MVLYYHKSNHNTKYNDKTDNRNEINYDYTYDNVIGWGYTLLYPCLRIEKDIPINLHQ